MIVPAILYTFKGKLLVGIFAVFTTVAVTEVFLGQLMIAVIVALIGATPPTVAIIIMARKQSAERKAGNKEILEGQEKVAAAVNGVSHELTKAKEAAARGEGIQQERSEERARQGDEALGAKAANPIPTPVIVENPKDKPAHVKSVE